MITGFNTDIEHDGVVYHVQTEDKGLETPLILSLVYSGGAILASKRARYEDLIAAGYSDEALSERLTRQHKLICAAIHAGRIDDLKRMSAPAAAGTRDTKETKGTKAPEPDREATVPQLEILRGEDERMALEADREAFEKEKARVEAEKEREALAAQEREALRAAEEAAAADATEGAVPPPSPPPPPLPLEAHAYSVHDQRRQSVMGEFAVTEDGLRITILGEREFRSGETPTLKVLVALRTGNQEQPVAKASVSVKVLGTTFRPQIYSAKTESDGMAVIAAQIPKFTSGRAAILIRAVAAGKATELRRVIVPG